MAKYKKIKWHPAFFQAIQAEFKDYKHLLTYEAEHQLTSEPLRMDTLIIKKPPDANIEKNIGQIFRGNNIVEYKSPNDNLTINDYNKVFGYAYLHAALQGICITDVTVTFVQTAHPRDLFRHLRNGRGLKVTEVFDGIYYITGEVMPVQIVESRRLSKDENLWVKALSNELTVTTLDRLLNESKKLNSKMGAYLYAILEANSEVFEEVVKMGKRSLAEVLDEMGYVEQSYVDGKVQAARLEAAKEAAKEAAEVTAKEAAKETAMMLFNEGDPLDKIARVTKLSDDELKKILFIKTN